MANPSAIMARVRSYGANLVIDNGKLKLVQGKKLPPAALEHIKQHATAIAAWLEAEGAFEERAAIIEFDGGTPREWAEAFAQFLTRTRPANVDEIEWSWFITTCGRMIDEAPRAVA